MSQRRDITTRSTNRPRSIALAAVVVALLAAACSSGSSSSSGPAGSQAIALPPCPLDALASATQPVEVVLWHSYAAKTKEALEALAAEYNASQSKVRVRVESQGTSYNELWKKFQSAAKAKDLPGIAILEDIATQAVADSGVILPAQSCIDAAKTDMSDFVKPAIDFYTVDGAFQPATVNLSSELLYFNRNHFRRAGLDPDKPPTTLAELRTTAEKIKAAGVVDKPLALSLQPWFVETWLTGAGSPTVDNDNGRGSGTTRAAAFDSDQGREVMAWIAGMVRDGLAEPIAYAGGDVGQYLAMANQKASMTIETSTAAQSVKAFLKGDTSVAGDNDTSNVDLTALDIDAAKVPGLRAPGKAQISGGAWYITNTTKPEVQAAAWDFLTWWNRTETQVQWNLRGSYLPFRVSAAKDAALVDAWRTDKAGRWLAISYDQLTTGVDPKFPGPLIGPYDKVRAALKTALDGVAFDGQDPATATKQASDEATKAIQAYDEER
ncbi:MAG: extracellular solute-binding protein [Acidimicrobiales bacterium]